jgi:hypothetical protein
MTNDEWREVLEHTRTRIRQAGFMAVDESVTLDFQSTASAKNDFLRYLSQLISALSERSHSGYMKALQRIQKSVCTENGGVVEGIEIRVSDRDYNLYRTERIDLSELNDLTLLIEQLQRLKGEIANSEAFNE